MDAPSGIQEPQDWPIRRPSYLASNQITPGKWRREQLLTRFEYPYGYPEGRGNSSEPSFVQSMKDW